MIVWRGDGRWNACRNVGGRRAGVVGRGGGVSAWQFVWRGDGMAARLCGGRRAKMGVVELVVIVMKMMKKRADALLGWR